MKRGPVGPQIEKAPPEGIDAFKRFYDADQLGDILESFNQVCDSAKIERGGRYVEFYPYLKAAYLVFKYSSLIRDINSYSYAFLGCVAF